VARAEDFEISSVGVLVFGIIPGAFVEPKGGLPGGEEEEANPHGAWDQGNWVSRVKILAAGSWANYVTAGVFLLLALGFTSATSYSNGIVYQAQSDYPAVQAGLTNGTLQEVNNQRIRGIEDIKAATEGIKPGDTVILNTTEGVFNVTTTSIQDFDGGYIGLQFVEIDTKYKGGFENYSDLVEWFASLLNIVAFVNLGIGLFNMLPVKPLDGGHILEALVERFAGEEYAQQVNTWSISVILLIVAVILYTIIGPF